MFHCGMIIVALPARGLRICSSGFCIGTEFEVCPLFRKSALILHFDTHAHQFSLEMARFVNRTIALRSSFLHNKNGLVRPLSTGQELTVTPLRNEYVGEQFLP